MQLSRSSVEDDDHPVATSGLARERFSESHRSFWVTALIGSIGLAVYLGSAIPTYGWLPFLLSGLTTLAAPIGLAAGKGQSERLYAVSYLVWLVLLGVSAAASGGAHSFILPLVAAYTLGFFTRLDPRQAGAFAGGSFALAMVPVLVRDWSGFVNSPWLLLSCAVGTLSMMPLATQMAAGELRQRGAATIDQLTGLLNRRGLEDRIAELSQQAAVIGQDTPIALVLGDLDHFKDTNDTYGHPRGDDVLRDVAYIMRKSLRRFELIYRIGGEEFLVVLPGHSASEAADAAEAIREAIETGRPGGLTATISIGVAAAPAHDVDFAALMEAADRALYAAKHGGRNRVEVSSDLGPGSTTHDTSADGDSPRGAGASHPPRLPSATS